MRTVKVYFDNGIIVTTRINGSIKEIKDYYKKGNVFNVGDGIKDELARVKKLEFI